MYDIKDCLVRGRRPVVMDHVNSVDTAWYKDTMKCALLETRVLSGVLHRLCHKELGEAFIAEEVNKQRVPSRAGFNAILYPEIPRVSNIGYCPMIAGSTNDFSTILTVLKHAQKISATMSQADTVITFDLVIYRKAEEIQWRFPDEYFSVVARMSGFRIALNFLSLLGKKKHVNSGLEDQLIESGVYDLGPTSAQRKGKSNNRGISGTLQSPVKCMFYLL